MKTIVPEGYKKTKVGIYPDDWKEIEVSKYVIDKKKFCNNDDIPLYSLTIEEGVVPKSQRYERSHLVKDNEDAYKYVEYGDFVYNPMNLRFGALAVHNEQKEVKVSAYYDVFGIKNDKVNLEYLYAYLKSERIMFYYNRMATGSLEEKKRVHYKEFKKFKFPMPLLKEQEKIAQILTTCDEAITKQEELIKEKEQLKKGFMRKLLSGEVRFSGFNDEWEEVRLGEIGNSFNGLSGKTGEDFGIGEAKYITYKNIFDYSKIKLDIFENVQISNDEKQNLVQFGDIFFTVSSETPEEVGMSSVLLDNVSNTYLNSFCFGYRLNNFNTLNPYFARFYFRSFQMRDKISRLAQGSTRFNLSKNEIMKLKIKLPSLPEQQKIAEVLSLADDEINLLKNELEELKLQKKALMQKLLTGQVRVKV